MKFSLSNRSKTLKSTGIDYENKTKLKNRKMNDAYFHISQIVVLWFYGLMHDYF